MLAWAGLALGVAAWLTSRVLSPMLSDPDNRNLEWLIGIPLGLGLLAVGLRTAAAARCSHRSAHTGQGVPAPPGTSV